jgi:hypothetical protein
MPLLGATSYLASDQDDHQIVAAMLNGGTQHFCFAIKTAASTLWADRSSGAEPNAGPGCRGI